MSKCDRCGREVQNQMHHDAIYHPEEGISDEASGYTKNSTEVEFGAGLR